ncbi:uncharacterized protein H6S33_009436 [Morchella sextelata]|uniref:uncharacterized protein n=1 Tax=Morchella sextelata TaxID=1174677 RepID=UPI001D052254|nr:uncharacterized protein H6S33_009436 [Morchella sextelata]KAH0613056.1 hypothetical protein H6S33_009436 [Morchella sextelata]
MRLAISILCFFTFLLQLTLGQVTADPYNPSPFSTIGVLQAATVNNISDILSGGTLSVNGMNIIIPRNLLVTLPSITVSWSELFTSAGALDLPRFGVTEWEVSVNANRKNGVYIAGMVYISQKFGHAVTGFITAIDYASGVMYVGGTWPDASNPVPTGTRVIINDPVGRFGRVYNAWRLMTADTDNPSIRAATGFPMCLPRTNPATEPEDLLCPSKNRPKNTNNIPLSVYQFDAPPVAAGRPDPNFFAPFMVGDFITYSGVYVDTNLVAAYSIEANLGFYTAPGTKPVYLAITEAQYGIVGNPAGEFAQTRIEGYTTDQTQNVEVYALDVDPCTGVTTERLLSSVVPRPNGRRGQWRYRPTPDITPSSREVLARVPSASMLNGNNITAGQYVQPIMDDGFIFPELVLFGNPEVVFDFDELPWLAKGAGPWLGGIPGAAEDPSGPIVGRLDPWPGVRADAAPVCNNVAPVIPVANAGPDMSVTGGQVVTLSGRTDTSNLPENTLTYKWLQASTGTAMALSCSTDGKICTFTAPGTATILVFQFTVSNAAGNSKDSATVNVVAPSPDVITLVSQTYSNRRGTGTLVIEARSSVTDGSSILSLGIVNPNYPSTAMTALGNGRFSSTTSGLARRPASIIITSSRGSRLQVAVN